MGHNVFISVWDVYRLSRLNLLIFVFIFSCSSLYSGLWSFTFSRQSDSETDSLWEIWTREQEVKNKVFEQPFVSLFQSSDVCFPPLFRFRIRWPGPGRASARECFVENILFNHDMLILSHQKHMQTRKTLEDENINSAACNWYNCSLTCNGPSSLFCVQEDAAAPDSVPALHHSRNRGDFMIFVTNGKMHCSSSLIRQAFNYNRRQQSTGRR